MYRNLPQVRYKIELEPKKNGKRKKVLNLQKILIINCDLFVCLFFSYNGLMTANVKAKHMTI